MRYLALATDYDGTLATHGTVPADALAALRRARDAGRRLILVTGRVWPELQAIFPEYRVFHRIVAENGALLIDPETGEQTLLGATPPEAFIERLHAAGVEIGAHTQSHPILSKISDADARREIGESKSRLEAIIGAPVTTFAYPNGRPRRDSPPRQSCATALGALVRGSPGNRERRQQGFGG